MSNWRQYFQDGGFTSKQRGSASSAWLSIIQSDEEKLKQWRHERQERAIYWKEVEKTESIEDYVHEITSFVCQDKVAVAAKHSSDVAAHLSGTTSSSNALHPRVRVASQKDLIHSQLTLSKTPRLKSKRGSQGTIVQLQEPWKALMEAALAMNHGRCIEIPVGGDISHLSETRRILYTFALDSLRTFKGDKRQLMALKNASVALSCTIDLSCDDLRDYFEDDFLVRAANASTCRHWRHDVRFVLEEVRILKGQYQEQQRAGEAVPEHWEAIMDIVEQVCRLCVKPSFGSCASEADVVAEWKAVLYPLLMDSEVFMRSGECVSESTKAVKALLDEEYNDFGTFGRKVDLLFHAHGQELANLEFKVAEATQLDIETQHLKNIRLNRAIMESQYEASVVKSTVLFLDFQGTPS
ncbi:hypothetical protein BG011_000706 [Mortierella polycephala]|uniref:Uncharacterized protein n=1 Tax=Mortierella polycephala TaxID=41804 RepID=A0A9P6PLB2_9FUNG|nr:hypothetical protein BG011_000706 [Mortierella polycephala]